MRKTPKRFGGDDRRLALAKTCLDKRLQMIGRRTPGADVAGANELHKSFAAKIVSTEAAVANP